MSVLSILLLSLDIEQGFLSEFSVEMLDVSSFKTYLILDHTREQFLAEIEIHRLLDENAPTKIDTIRNELILFGNNSLFIIQNKYADGI